jgi:hypothetical protein
MVVTSINLYWNHQFELATLSNISQKRHIGTHIYEQVALKIMAFNQQTLLPTIPMIWACNAPTLATFIFDQKVKKKDKSNLPKACTIVPIYPSVGWKYPFYSTNWVRVNTKFQ